MHLKKNVDLKTFEIWLNEEEKSIIKRNGKLDEIIKLCNECDYKPVLYVLGKNDSISSIAEILMRNSE